MSAMASSLAVDGVFDPSLLFLESGTEEETQSGSSLIILNRPFKIDQAIECAWKRADYRICADGGANRLWQACQGRDQFLEDLGDVVPTAVVGDFDSIKVSVMHAYAAKGAKVEEDRDQYKTDFGKSVRVLREYRSGSSPAGKTLKYQQQSDLLILSDLSGRIDQGLGILHEMLRETKAPENEGTRLWLINNDNVSWILPRGRNVLRGLRAQWPAGGAAAVGEPLFSPNVGILPIYGRAVITTSGLEWDVKDWQTEMGVKISTSNHVVRDEVVIETSNDVLFTIERNTE